MELTDDALQLFDLLMKMMLKDRLGAVVYIQDLVDQAMPSDEEYRHSYKVS